ncbi:MFS transporter [Rhodococcus globerulus]|uniref:MFS transporter n=1 Tax=Rhodococcus globerulus TaxID=33008 RepID=A0ABU4C2X3_RHOGO|nr:MFS transporter [Rhodococcus globerulus]MDV6270854.1 MFS transporter [Rhodococcus globerulus]
MSPPTITGKPESSSRSWIVVTTLALTGTAVSLQQTLVLPLLPDLPTLLNTTADNASWLVTATLLFGAVSIPTVTRLADMFGKKRMMLVALALMVLGSILGALSTELALLITARAMQGVGLSLVPVGIAIMRDELPRERVPLGVALMSASLAIGSGAGLPLSGLIAAHLDWHAIFWVTGMVGIVVLVAVWSVIDESPVKTGGAFDYRGAIIGTVALTAVMLALSKGAHWGWTARPTVALTVVGVALLIAWVPMELRVPNPLVNVRVAARPTVLLVNFSSLLLGFAMFANMLVTPQLLQLPTSSGYGLGFDVLETGLWMAPIALIFGAMAPVSANLIRRYGPQMTLLAGALVMAGSYIARVYLSDNLWQIVAGSVLVGAGTSMTYAALPTLIIGAVPVTESASANGLNTLLRYLGTSIASAVMAAVTTMSMTRIADNVFPSFAAFLLVFWIAAGSSLLAGVIALVLLGLRDAPDESRKRPGRVRDAAVRGRVIGNTGRPIRNAVVTVLTPGGVQVDWSQVDSAGDYSVAIPGSGRYLVVTAAEGWTPDSRLSDLVERREIEEIVLKERLTITGTVTDTSGRLTGAVIVLTRQSGEAIGSSVSGPVGTYSMPLPPNGKYVITACTATSTVVHAVTVWGAAVVVDLELPEPDNSVTTVVDVGRMTAR